MQYNTGKLMAAILLCANMHICASAQQQRALIIGIDTYAPSGAATAANSSGRTEWPNLDGCKNDAIAMKNEAVIRWGF